MPTKRCELLLAGLVLDTQAIDYLRVQRPHLLVAISQGVSGAFAAGLAPGGRLLYDAVLVAPAVRTGERDLPVTEAALKKLGGPQAANLIWVGVVAGVSGWFSPEGLARAIDEHLPPRLRDVNQRALALGMGPGRALVSTT